MSFIKIHALTVIMKGDINYRDSNCFLNQALNMFISAVKPAIDNMGSLWKLICFWSQHQAVF